MGKEADYIPALFTETQEAAETYRRLLEDHEIKVLVGYDELEEVMGSVPDNLEGEEGIPVFVPAENLDEASEIIDDFDNQDEFEEVDDESAEDDEEDEEEFEFDEDDFEEFEEFSDDDEDDFDFDKI